MTLKEANSLKEGDIIYEKKTGRPFKFLKQVEVRSISLGYRFATYGEPRMELAVDLVEGHDYGKQRPITNGPYFIIRRERMTLKKEDNR